MTYGVVIPAAGQGKRMGASVNKLRLELKGKPIIVWTIEAFAKDVACTEIVLAIREDERGWFERELGHIRTKITYTAGGEERQQSVYRGLQALTDCEYVMIHDGARPFIRLEQLQAVRQAVGNQAAMLAVPVKDTVKQVRDGQVVRTVPREDVWLAQTPQAFRHADILAVHERAEAAGFIGTDDASLFEWAGEVVRVIPGDYTNIKMTTPEDLIFGEAIVSKEEY